MWFGCILLPYKSIYQWQFHLSLSPSMQQTQRFIHVFYTSRIYGDVKMAVPSPQDEVGEGVTID